MIEIQDLNSQQIKILELLMDENYIQKDLQSVLNMTSPGLLYHLEKLEKLNFIQKKTIQKVGNAKINEISLDPIQLQHIRTILNKPIDICTLITGYGELYDGYKIPDEAFALLQNKHYKIDRIVCIATRKSKMIRDEKELTENLVKVDKYYADYEYLDFRNPESKFFKEIDAILREELKNSNLVIDITPLSKLYSFEMLKRANQYKLACYCIGKDMDQKDFVLWMTDVKLNGEMKK
jgi:DNA-binding MarR family transcriptional regulator